MVALPCDNFAAGPFKHPGIDAAENACNGPDVCWWEKAVRHVMKRQATVICFYKPNLNQIVVRWLYEGPVVLFME